MSQTPKSNNAHPTCLTLPSFPAPNHKPQNQKMRSPPVCGYPLSLHQITNHKDTNHQITKLRSPPNQKNAQPTCLQPPYFPAPTPKNYKNVTNQQIKKCAAHLSAARLFSCTKSQTTKSKNAQPTCLQPPYFPAPTPKNYKNVTNQQIKKCAAHLSAARLFSCTKLQTTKSQKCAAHQIKRMRSLPVCGCPLSLHQITNHQITKMRSPPNQKNAQPTCLRLPSLPAPNQKPRNHKPPNHKNAQPTKSKRMRSPPVCSCPLSLRRHLGLPCLLYHAVLVLVQLHTAAHAQTHTHEFKMSVGACSLLLHMVHVLVQLHTAAHAQTHTHTHT